MHRNTHPPEPVHVPGMHKGEEFVLEKGREPGRDNRRQYRSARDSTSVNPADREPILAAMPSLPPA